MKRSKKETEILREIVGADGTKVHYTGGAPDQRRELARKYRSVTPEFRSKTTSGKAAAQVAEMRQVVGVTRKGNPIKDKPTPPPSLTDIVAAQVAAMRKAAGGKK